MDFDPSQVVVNPDGTVQVPAAAYEALLRRQAPAPPPAPAPAPAALPDALIGDAAEYMRAAAAAAGVTINPATYRQAAELMAAKIGPAALASKSPALVGLASAFLAGGDFKIHIAPAGPPAAEVPPWVAQAQEIARTGIKPSRGLTGRRTSYSPEVQAAAAAGLGTPASPLPSTATPMRGPGGMPLPPVAPGQAPPWRASGLKPAQGLRPRR